MNAGQGQYQLFALGDYNNSSVLANNKDYPIIKPENKDGKDVYHIGDVTIKAHATFMEYTPTAPNGTIPFSAFLADDLTGGGNSKVSGR